MKRILYFSNCDINMKTGHGQMIRAHHKMLNQLYPDSVITVIMSDQEYNNGYYNLPCPSQIEKLMAVLNGYSPYISLESIRFILKLIDEKDIHLVLIESSMFGKLIWRIKKHKPEIKVVAYFTDIEADLLQQEMANSGLKRSFICRRLMRNERMTVEYADKKFVLNKRDDNLYQKIYENKPDAIIPIIINTQNVSDAVSFHQAGDKLKLLFVGGDFWPNVVGIRWFIDKVLPSVSVPCELEIVGLYMEKYREEWENCSSHVRVIGTVDDLKPYFDEADLFIAPIREGGGMKVKTAEALSFGKTFIGLEESLVGYWEFIPGDLKDGGIYLCEGEKDFAERINGFYNQTFEKSRKDIKNFIQSLCSYEVNFEIFKKLFEE